jgi:uncharacterized protein YndB with AHSA1/START domain
VAEGNGDGLRITRVFDAPRDAVWREFTEPEAFADWFGGTHAEVPIDSVTWNVRPGESWRATMFAGPARQEIRWKGEFVEVVEPERLVFTVTDRPDEEARELCTVVLAELDGDRTEMRFSQTGGGLPPEGYERAKQGWGTFFDVLAARLAEAD